MKDLKTLLSSDATDFERQLLAAAAGERPSPELQLRMQQALGLGPAALQGPDASTGGPELGGVQAASKWTAGKWLKLALGVGAGAGLVAGGLVIASSEPAPLPRATRAASEPPALTPSEPAPAAPVAAPAANASGEAAASAAPSSAAPSSAAPSSAALSRELREEIDLLDRVRSALDQRDAREASALLDRYATRFPEGKLAREATVLRARTAQLARTGR